MCWATRAKPAPVRRPEISTGGSTEGWHYFLTRWRAYASAVHLSAEDIPVQLLECLEPNLRRTLAVREENPKVARVALTRMVQDRGESTQPDSMARTRCVDSQ